MLIVMCALLALATVPLAGGRLGRLAGLRLRAVPLVVSALLIQIVIISVVPDLPRPLAVTAHLLTYAMAATFIWWNRSVPGVPLLGLGAACNGLTILLNGGTLPASHRALEMAGAHLSPDEFLNSGVLPHPVLPWLGDVFAVPSWVPFANIFSLGDVLIVIGMAYGAHVVCGSRLARRGRHRRDRTPTAV